MIKWQRVTYFGLFLGVLGVIIMAGATIHQMWLSQNQPSRWSDAWIEYLGKRIIDSELSLAGNVAVLIGVSCMAIGNAKSSPVDEGDKKQ